MNFEDLQKRYSEDALISDDFIITYNLAFNTHINLQLLHDSLCFTIKI